MELIEHTELVNKIHLVRGQKVMLDSDLADLYAIETKQLKRQVRRNILRFPLDFMFELTKEEYDVLRCQNGTLKKQGQHSKYAVMAFTEPGVAQLSSVIHSARAIQVNIQIIRLFTRMRALLMTQRELVLKMEKLEVNLKDQDREIKLLFRYLKKLTVQEEVKERPVIGFKK